MTNTVPPGQRLEVVVRCCDLDANVDFFRNDLGWRIDTISPADDPAEVVLVSESGVVRLVRDEIDVPVEFSIDGDEVRTVRTPNGSSITVRVRDLVVPDSVPSLTVVPADTGSFGTGRAGMQYRDLLPGRWGGRFIASHISVFEEGEVADWVHFHRIRFQMIYVASGWVDVVYEDQGEPFRMHAGDCVLQPPEIRHRVLRSSAGMEVIEVGCPAVHDTVADHELVLPTDAVSPDRDFNGQRFLRHIASDADPAPWIVDGVVGRDTGISVATDGLAGAVVLSATTGAVRSSDALEQTGEFALLVGLAGGATLSIDGYGAVDLGRGGAISLPRNARWRWTEWPDDHEVLVVSLGPDVIQRAS